MDKVVALPAPKPRSVVTRNVAWVYVAVLTVMALGQLFAFEKFIPLIEKYGVTESIATVLASLIVIIEVFAVPFLLRMRLSLLMRWVGLVFGLLVPVVWIVLSFVAITSGTSVANGGILGAKVSIGAELQLFVAIVLLGMASYSAYGLWPKSKGD